MSSKLCPYVLMSESFDRRTKEQKQLIRIFSKVCLYVLLSIFLTVCYFLEGKHGGMCSPKIGEPSQQHRGINELLQMPFYRNKRARPLLIGENFSDRSYYV